VLSIRRLRERLPLVVFILLLVLLLMMIGIACVCATDHPMKAVDRTLSAASAMPAVIEVWTYTLAAILVVLLVVPQRRRALGRASPQELQRFLF
jgi:predicted acyltransferase